VGKTAAFRQDELYTMNVSFSRKQGSEVLQDAGYVGSVNVVKKAVHEDKVVLRALWSNVAGCIGDEEVAMVAAAREVNVSRIDVYPQIRRMVKAGSVCTGAATYIKDAFDGREVVVFEDARELLPGERQLGEVEEERLFEEIFEESHGRQ